MVRSWSWISPLLALLLVHQLVVADDSASLPAEHRGLPLPPPGYGPLPLQSGAQPSYGNVLGAPGPVAPGPDDAWPLANPADMPQIKNLQVQCEKTHMRVNMEFDRPFYGMIFSKGHYSDPNCVHVRPGTGQLSATFDVYLNSCGMTSSANSLTGAGYGQPSPTGSFVENTIIIQYDPLVQEVWDQARRLRCTWYDYYEKSVTFRPFAVDMVNAVTANFLGDNLQCWMQIQVGKGPWASEVSGIVKIGQTMTMVLAIKDDENKFDMLVRNCVAHDGVRAPIQLVDQYGCVLRPKIMSRFQKVKNFGPSASVVSYAYFQAFKFPDSMNVHFQCVIQVCRHNCPEPRCEGDLGYAASNNNAPDPRVPSYAGATSAESVPSVSYAPAPAGPAPSAGQYGSAPLPQPLPIPARPAGVNLPRPQLLQPNYGSINREGLADESDDKPDEKRPSIAGRPRSVENNVPVTITANRTRRSVDGLPVLRIYKRDTQEMTDVETVRILQVVAPGDVAFNLGAANETVVVQDLSRFPDSNHICMSTPSFVGGLVMLLLVLIVAVIVSTFLLLRVRSFERDSKTSSSSMLHPGFDNAEFVKVAN